jgi:hypothetical protein
MKCNPWVVANLLGICGVLGGCSSAPKPAAKPPPLALQPDCAWAAGAGGESQMACLLSDEIPDTQWDAAHPGSVACSSTSFSVFKQSLATPLRLSFGQKDDGGFMRVKITGTLGPGTHTGQVGQSAGNDCDATLGPVATISTRYGGSYTAVVDKSQVPACVLQSQLVLSTFEQTWSKVLPVDMRQVAREITSDALQKRLDLEVAVRANKYWRPSAPFLPEVVVGRNGRCAEGFRAFSGR